MMRRNLARRLNQLEARFKPTAEPMTIRVVFVNVDREVTGGFELQVGRQGSVID
jgi:hypothetical protein